MQPVRELTQLEVEEGKRGINNHDLTATEVQALVRKMDQSKAKWRRLRDQGSNTVYEQMLKQENEVLYFNYPSLFDLHARDSLDGTFFEMLQLKRKIERGEITSEQASAAIGKALFDRFVPHAVNSNAPAPAPKLSYEEYYRRNQE